MIHVVVSLGSLPLNLLLLSTSLIGSLASGLMSIGSVLLSAPLLIPALSFALLPAFGFGTVLGVIEEHPEIVALGALCIGIIIALFFLLHNGLNRNRNGNGFHTINGNGNINGKNGIKTHSNGINKNGTRNGNKIAKNGDIIKKNELNNRKTTK